MDFYGTTAVDGSAPGWSPAECEIIELQASACIIFAGNGRAGTTFDPKKNKSLIADIRKNGQQTPVLARSRGGSYEVIAGTRRLGAIRALNAEGCPMTIKAIVGELSDEAAWLVAEKENADRRSLSPMQRARSWDYAIRMFHNGRQDLFAESAGEDPSVVSRTLMILKIPQEVLDAVQDPEAVSVHFASQLVPELGNDERAAIIRETARNISQTRGPVRAPQLLDELLSTHVEIAARAPVQFGLADSPGHAVLKRNRDGSAALRVKRIDLDAHPMRARRALFAAINAELRRFLQLEANVRGSEAPPQEPDLLSE
jgi:ParB family chromosome partitioning protein